MRKPLCDWPCDLLRRCRELPIYFQPASLSQAARSCGWLFSHWVMDCVSSLLILLFMQVQYFSTVFCDKRETPRHARHSAAP